MSYTRFLASAVAILASLLAFGTAAAEAPRSELWNDFVTARTEESRPPFPDFSYAGYRRSEEPIPHVTGPIFNVLDYGAVPDDELSDRNAIQAAITAAESAGGGVVFFPAGRFHTNTLSQVESTIRIRRSNIVIRGSGSREGGTELFMERNFTPTDSSRFWTTPWMFEISPASQSQPLLATPTEFAPMGSNVIVVDTPGNIIAGDWLSIRMADADAMEDFLTPYAASGAWARLYNDGIRATEQHQVDWVDGNRIHLKSRILTDIDPAYNWRVLRFANIQEIGFEDILFLGNWRERFVHHQNAIHDYGWSALYFIHCANNWVQRCRFVNWNYAIQMDRTAYSTVLHSSIEGNGGHFGFVARGGTNTLFGLVQDPSNSFHGASWGYESSGVVFWRYDYGITSSFDGHSGTPYATLIDASSGGLTYGRSGGPIEGLPNHLRDLVLWNFQQLGDPSPNHDFWRPDPFAYDKYILPWIIGFTGTGTTFVESKVTLENFGQQVDPASLFEAQLALRMGTLPEWIPQAKRDWDVLRETEIIHPTVDSVVVVNSESLNDNIINTLTAEIQFNGLSEFATNLQISEDRQTTVSLLLDGKTDILPWTFRDGEDSTRSLYFTFSNITSTAEEIRLDIFIDREAPEIPSFTMLPPANSNDPYPVIEWTTASDSDGSGIHGYELEITHPLGSLVVRPIIETTFGQMLLEDTYSFRVRSVDRAGNKSLWSEVSPSTRIDVTPPVVVSGAIIAPGKRVEGTWYSDSTELVVAALGEPLVEVEMCYDGDVYTSTVEEGRDFSATIPAGNEGAKTITFLSIDSAGNQSMSEALHVVIDRTAPVISFPTTELIPHRSLEPVFIPFQFQETNRFYFVDSALFAEASGNIVYTGATLEGSTILLQIDTNPPDAIPAGTIRVRAFEGLLTDHAGNQSDLTGWSPLVLVDAEAPSGHILPRLPFQAGGEISLQLLAIDDPSTDTVTLELWVAEPGLPWKAAPSATVIGAGVVVYTVPELGEPADGIYQFAVRATDRVGNSNFHLTGPFSPNAIFPITYNTISTTEFSHSIQQPGSFLFPITNESVADFEVISLIQPGELEMRLIDGIPVIPPGYDSTQFLPLHWTLDSRDLILQSGTITFPIPNDLPAGIDAVTIAWRFPPGGGRAEAHPIFSEASIHPGQLTVSVCELDGQWLLGTPKALLPPDMFQLY